MTNLCTEQFGAKKLFIGEKEYTSFNLRADNDAAVSYAADELKKYMGKMELCADSGELSFVLTLDASLPPDAYRLDFDECEIRIVGGSGRGVLYGVYGFLDKYAGVRFLTPELEVCKDGDIKLVPGSSYSYTPAFDLRQIDWFSARFSQEWMAKSGINCCDWNPNFPEHLGGSKNYGGLFVHTIGRLTQTPDDSQPCLSDPENLKKAIANVRDVLAKHPTTNIVSVSQNDNWNCCKCEKCAAIDAEEGSPSGAMLRFVNAVAADIATDYPNVTVDTLAYTYTQKAPKITKPLPNVCVRLCPILCHFTHPLDDNSCERNSTFCNDLVEWSKICKNIYIWDYSNNYRFSIPTFPNLGVIRANMQFFADHNVKGMFPQGNYYSTSGEFGELRAYLLAKLMMNPYMSQREYYNYMNDFLRGYYGDGWRYIRAYIDETTALAATNCQNIYASPFDGIEEEAYRAMEKNFELWWGKAEELAGDRVEFVKRSRLQWRYIRLMLHPAADQAKRLIDEVNTYKISWMEGAGGYSLPEDADLSLPPHQWYKFTWWIS